MIRPLTNITQTVQNDIQTSAERGNKLEKKLALHLGGYQKRQKMLKGRINEAYDALGTAGNALESFRTLQIAEGAAINGRLEKLREEVGYVSRREREAQEVYRSRKEELDSLGGLTPRN